MTLQRRAEITVRGEPDRGPKTPLDISYNQLTMRSTGAFPLNRQRSNTTNDQFVVRRRPSGFSVGPKKIGNSGETGSERRRWAGKKKIAGSRQRNSQSGRSGDSDLSNLLVTPLRSSLEKKPRRRALSATFCSTSFLRKRRKKKVTLYNFFFSW